MITTALDVGRARALTPGCEQVLYVDGLGCARQRLRGRDGGPYAGLLKAPFVP